MKLHSSLALTAAALAGVALTSCQAKEEAKPAEPGKSAPAEIAVTASDSACELSGNEGATGANTFVITNNGNKVTEFYVYGEGERVMGEVENISPGLQRKLIVQLTEPGTYQTACKPGMVGDGIRGDFKVAGATVQIDTWATHYTLHTDANGDYALWLDVRNNPLTVIAAKDGYQPQAVTVKLSKGKTVTATFTLLKD